MFTAIWVLYSLIGLVVFVYGWGTCKLKDRVDALDLFLCNRATCEDLRELQRKVGRLEKELERMREALNHAVCKPISDKNDELI